MYSQMTHVYQSIRNPETLKLSCVCYIMASRARVRPGDPFATGDLQDRATRGFWTEAW